MQFVCKVFVLLLFFVHLTAQNNALLVSGPMLGYVEHREALIWLQVSPTVSQVAVQYWKATQPQTVQTQLYNGVLQQPFNPIKVVLSGLDMNTQYQYRILLNGSELTFSYPLAFSTKKLWEWREDPPEFSFIFGSCAYINDEPYDRPGKPYGQPIDILQTMTRHPADFMLWVGDNVYLREADWSSASGIQYRYQHVRQLPELQPFLAAKPHYAVWDDHDFGPNDSNFSYELKHVTLQTFMDFWGNKSYGEPHNKGIYGKFTWGDAEFFMLDNRYHRWQEKLPYDMPQKRFLGQQQMEWLLNGLSSSTATFKIIVSGSQMLNPMNDFECFTHYQAEYNTLIGHISNQKINGVLFLSGDRHFSEIIKVTTDNAYPLYDITSSPITSRAYTNVANEKEGKNAYRVSGTLAAEQNFVKVAFAGKRNNRKLVITCHNTADEQLWKYEIPELELQNGK